MGYEEPTLGRDGEEGARARPPSRVLLYPSQPPSIVELEAPRSKSFFYRYAGILLTGRGCIRGIPEADDAINTLDVLLEAGAALVSDERVCLDYLRESSSYSVDTGCSGGALRVTLAALLAAAPLGSRIEVRVCPRMFQRLEEATLRLWAHFGSFELRPDARKIIIVKRRDPLEYKLVSRDSSQPVSGALIAAAVTSALLSTPVRVSLVTSVSRGHVYQTLEALREAGIGIDKLSVLEAGSTLSIVGVIDAQQRRLVLTTPGDWSLASLLLPFAVRSHLKIRGLWRPWPGPGDHNAALYARIVGFESYVRVDDDAAWSVGLGEPRNAVLSVGDEPDLAVSLTFASAALGSTISLYGVKHLALKESNRLETITEALRVLGFPAYHNNTAIHLAGGRATTPLRAEYGCPGDHRIAMGFAALACSLGVSVLLERADCVSKSWAGFWHFIRAARLCNVEVVEG